MCSSDLRGTFVDKREQVRAIVRARLVEVAIPDSRFGLDITHFVPDFVGSDRCTDRVGELASWNDASVVFVAPDNSLAALRHAALDAGKTVLVPTYGMQRGIVRLSADVPPDQRRFAATLDGLETFGTRLDLDALAAVGRIDLILTGATAVTQSGAHVGGGQAYLDLEWGLLAELDLVAASTPTVCIVHDCQLIDAPLNPGRFGITIDTVVTPQGTHHTECPWPRPTGIVWEQLDGRLFDELAYLDALAQRRTSPLRFERNSA